MTSNTVKLSISLAVTEPAELSISNPSQAESMQLVATIKQDASPFPDKPITLLTMYTVLDNGPADAFWHRTMSYPTDVEDSNIVISMRPRHVRINSGRAGGDRDMRHRPDHQFIIVPPPGHGSVDVRWSLAPEHLLRFYSEDGDLGERLKRFKPGQTFKIEPSDLTVFWWTFGSLHTDLMNKKLSRWSLPDTVPLVRDPGSDESDEVNRSLIDYVDRKTLHNIISDWDLPGTPDPDDEKPPNVKEMREEQWVFGEPVNGLEVSCNNSGFAIFKFTE